MDTQEGRNKKIVGHRRRLNKLGVPRYAERESVFEGSNTGDSHTIRKQEREVTTLEEKAREETGPMKTLGEISREISNEYVRVKKGVRPYGGRLVRVSRWDGDYVDVFALTHRLDDIRRYRRDEVESE
jgi:hypothetical protein